METITDAWARILADLERRARDLDEEVRRYPGPIARCDDQLPGLIEQRVRAWELVKRARALRDEALEAERLPR